MQWLAFLQTAGAMKTTPTAATEILLVLHPLHLKMKAEAQAGI
jgi:hypothetical protein